MSLSKQFTRREKILLTILAILFLGCVYFLAVQRPVSDAQMNLQQETDRLNTELMVLEAKQQNMDRMRAELEQMTDQQSIAPIPTYDNLQQLMGFLNAALSPANDYSFQFQDVQKEENSSILRRGLSLSFTCPSYETARQIAQQLQNCPYRCQLSNFSMAPAGTRNQPQPESLPLTSGAVQASLTITFFETTTA